MTDLEKLESEIKAAIPLSAALGLKVEARSVDGILLSAPLFPNTNHKSTAFGGSVYSLAVLSCWALVSEAIQDRKLDVDYVVVQDGNISYDLPVTADFRAQSSWPDENAREKFLRTLERKGLARTTLRSVVRVGHSICAKLEARFAAELTGRTKA